MKKWWKTLTILLLVLMFAGAITSATYAAPRFNKTSVQLKQKKKKKLSLKGLSKKQQKKQWKFASSDKSIVTVKKTSKTTCRITAKKNDGYAVIRAKQGSVVVYMLVCVGNGGAPTYSGITSSWAAVGNLPLPVPATAASTPTPAPTPTPTPEPEKDDFYASATDITITSLSSQKVEITYSKLSNYSVNYEILDRDACFKCCWGYDKSDKKPLYILPESPLVKGTYSIRITNESDDREIILKVKVEPSDSNWYAADYVDNAGVPNGNRYVTNESRFTGKFNKLINLEAAFAIEKDYVTVELWTLGRVKVKNRLSIDMGYDVTVEDEKGDEHTMAAYMKAGSDIMCIANATDDSSSEFINLMEAGGILKVSISTQNHLIEYQFDVDCKGFKEAYAQL